MLMCSDFVVFCVSSGYSGSAYQECIWFKCKMRIWESFKPEEKIWVLDSDSVIGKGKVWGRKNETEPKVQEKWAQKKLVFFRVQPSFK